MSRTDITLDPVALIHDVSRDNVESLQSLLVMPVGVRRENLLALAVAFHKANAPADLRPHVAAATFYYSLSRDPMPAFGRLLLAVRDCDLDEIDNALVRLTEVTE